MGISIKGMEISYTDLYTDNKIYSSTINGYVVDFSIGEMEGTIPIESSKELSIEEMKESIKTRIIEMVTGKNMGARK